VRVTGIERVKEKNLFIPPRLQLGSLDSNFEYFSLNGGVTLEYVLKEPKR